ncbi:hypothetical protein N7541_006055 [Penicillium brevicompactum]|uniref:Uncharacterized protein n=1 Tax=Penicillium brevicompactum TaxID=5074 RepID=A0A9W9R4D7_PENBR|nr:hypothetical protein N7541_006055 [Penicillium brevicompactum]
MSPNIEDNSNLDLQALEGHVLPSLVHNEVNSWNAGTDNPNCNFRTGNKISAGGCPCGVN